MKRIPRPGMVAAIGLGMVLMVASLAAEELYIPDNIFFYQPVASPSGQATIWSNPAGLASGQMGSMILFTQRRNRIIYDWGSASTARMFGFAYREVKEGNQPNLNEYILAFGGGKETRFGLSYRYIKNGPGDLNHRHLWNAGFLVQRNANVSIGAKFENLNRGKINGVRSDMRMVYGIAARLYKNLVTASFDVGMTNKRGINRADFRTGVEVRPITGLYVYADFDNHTQFNIGLRANFGSGYAGHYHSIDRHGSSLLSTSYIGSVAGVQPSLTKPKAKTMMVDLDGELPENPPTPIWRPAPLRFFDYLDGIHRAAVDPGVKDIFLQIGSLHCGFGKAEELAEALAYFRSHGKKVTAYLAEPGNLSYMLASGADRIIIPPVSELRLIGLHAELMTYKGLMDKIGVEADMERIDEYKSYPEPFMFDRPTEPYREQVDRLLDSLYAALVSTIAENRRLTADSVERLIDNAPLTSVQAVGSGLVDERMYLDEAITQFGSSEKALFGSQISLTEYLRQPVTSDRWGEPEKVAVIIADGDISSGQSGGRVGEYEMLDAIAQARNRHDIRGIVLRVNSPGGSALASDLIWHEIDKTARQKPLIISMGNVAASGGYYISCVPSPIFVDQTTITGSIGVFGGKPNLEKLYDKIGVYSESHSRGQNAAMYSMTQPFTPEQRQKLKFELTEFYQNFTAKVAAARSLTPDSVNLIGRGQVWTGKEALANGLADRTGGLYQAIREVCRESGVDLKETKILTIPQKRYLIKNPFDLPALMSHAVETVLGHGKSAPALAEFATDEVLFRMPYDIEIQ